MIETLVGLAKLDPPYGNCPRLLSSNSRLAEVGLPEIVVRLVDAAVAVAVGPQVGGRALGVSPHDLVGGVDAAVEVVVARQRDAEVLPGIDHRAGDRAEAEQLEGQVAGVAVADRLAGRVVIRPLHRRDRCGCRVDRVQVAAADARAPDKHRNRVIRRERWGRRD